MFNRLIKINNKEYSSLNRAIQDKEVNIHNLTCATVYNRYNKGWSINKIFNTPSRNKPKNLKEDD